MLFPRPATLLRLEAPDWILILARLGVVSSVVHIPLSVLVFDLPGRAFFSGVLLVMSAAVLRWRRPGFLAAYAYVVALLDGGITVYEMATTQEPATVTAARLLFSALLIGLGRAAGRSTAAPP